MAIQPIYKYGIWHQAEHDIKVEIISYLGQRNGESWWFIKGPDGGKTGVPESQISFRYNKPWQTKENEIYLESNQRRLAQLVELLAYIEMVAGSNPVPPIIFGTIAQLEEHRIVDPKVAGSNPVGTA